MKYLSKNTSKLSVIVPKTLVKGAVERNRLRRAAYRVFAVGGLFGIAAPEKIHAVFFVRGIPKNKYATGVFVEDIKTLIKNF